MSELSVVEDRKQYSALLAERAWWDFGWKDLSDYFQPWRSRFLSSDALKPKRNEKNARNRALLAVRVARAGLMAGLTPQARPWFALTTPDPEMSDFKPYKEWLYVVQRLMFNMFARTNIYDTLHESYGDDVTFGTSSLYVEDDDLDIVRGCVAPIGSFVAANSARLEVDTWFRRIIMTARQMAQKFGIERCSQAVKSAFDQSNYSHGFEVIQAIRPRDERDSSRLDSKNMPYSSCWFEMNGTPNDTYLRESGYRRFPVLVSRWEKTGEDVYGTPPAAACLGVARGLQKFESRRLQALDMIIRPPLNAPTSMRSDGGATSQPGEVNYADPSGPHNKIEPAVIVDPRIFMEAREELHDLESMIDAAMMVDLFLLIANDQRSGITAEEIRAKKEERLLQVGPTIERMQREKHRPLILDTFDIMEFRKELPDRPAGLEGVKLGVEFLAPLAQAQRAVATDAMERTTAFYINTSKFFPSILDWYDEDEAAQEYPRAVGAPPKLIRDESVVKKIRADRAKADQMQQALAAAKPVKDLATATKVASEAQPKPGSVLANLAANVPPPTAPASAVLPPGLSVVPGAN